jgi:TolA-binding protein
MKELALSIMLCALCSLNFGQRPSSKDFEVLKENTKLLEGNIKVLEANSKTNEANTKVLESKIENLKLEIENLKSLIKEQNLKLEKVLSGSQATQNQAYGAPSTGTKSKTTAEPTAPAPKKNVSTASAQCIAITQKGSRCSRAAGTSGYCWQHAK